MHYIKNPTVTEEHLQKFASNDFYIEAWQKKLKWNWGAFWLGGIFLLYRKMYLAFIIFLAANVFMLIVTSSVNLSTIEFRALFMLMLNTPLAFFINEIYLRHAEKKIEKIMKNHADDKLQDYHIRKVGGFNFFIPFTVFFVMPVCLTLLYVNLFQ
ncbi:DUF2628 domain-containing protein [Paenibacillus sp. MZ04-78.2]|uniref:DUF2628 domain-containing protein n=1 Tax=Paenibacillus sp. MZ04-78.2 TaxID=2962034 RepID=UPI0020B6583E|nr:DUF2628 domain-containing protein [Paenibacillus sp. MZ04-78.2]MCP3775225.1 DUF2628 domain-containing protein [Paenibacillus sp. MZ04-78.2]